MLGAIEFLAREPRDPDAHLLETMTSLGGRIGHCVERWRAEDRLRESDARKSAILDAAFDCIITMDAAGLVVEVNRAAERTFGYTADEMVGRELAELIIPPSLREPHRRGVERYVATGEATMVGHPVELPGDALRRQRVPGRDRDHAAAAARAAAVHRVPARHHRAQARRAGAAHARRRAGRAAPRRDRRRERGRPGARVRAW